MLRPDELEDHLDRLVGAGVLAPADRETVSYELSHAYREFRVGADVPFDPVQASAIPEALQGSGEDEILEEANRLRAFGVEGDASELVLFASTIARFDDIASQAEIPQHFLPLTKADIQPFIATHSGGLLYCWREDCDPCDIMCEHLSELVASGSIPTERLGLGAVYGPPMGEFLREEYAVGVAPTLLFFLDGAIETRLIGGKAKHIIETEVEILLEQLNAE